MKKMAICFGLIVATAAISAFTTKFMGDKKNADTQVLLGMLYQQSAAEYRALCFQAYNIARNQVDIAAKSGKTNLAIITDLDETAIDNSEGEAYAYKNDIAYDFGQLHKWWLFGKAKAVPGAVEFFQYAKEKGIDIYYISNRPADHDVVASTMSNMHVLGFPFTNPADSTHFLFQPGQAPPTKEPRRRRVSDTLNKEVILLLGDNVIDINAAFDKLNGNYLTPDERSRLVDNFRNLWGSRYIVFPNAYYGDWESSLYNNRQGLTNEQKDMIRQEMLKAADYTGQK